MQPRKFILQRLLTFEVLVVMHQQGVFARSRIEEPVPVAYGTLRRHVPPVDATGAGPDDSLDRRGSTVVRGVIVNTQFDI
jgi:hypothetical protein